MDGSHVQCPERSSRAECGLLGGTFSPLPLRSFLDVPRELTNAVAIAAGRIHSVALTADGRIFAWGDNRYGQCNVPANATNVVAISASETRTLILKGDGSVQSWGSPPGLNVIPANLQNVVGIAAGWSYSLASRRFRRARRIGQVRRRPACHSPSLRVHPWSSRQKPCVCRVFLMNGRPLVSETVSNVAS